VNLATDTRLAKARELFRTSPKDGLAALTGLAEEGSVPSMINLGLAYRFGKAGPIDCRESERWYLAAANRGSTLANYLLGRLYLHEGRLSEAKASFTEGASREHAPSLHALSRMYFSGTGVQRDQVLGKSLALRAIAMGSVFARSGLGVYLMRHPSRWQDVLKGAVLWLVALFAFLKVLATEGRQSTRLL
jgi:TPR repeat protein